ncbi:two-component hybrid sensor and regulator [Sulfurospirillum multivorans DSM 12446]|uniref:Two-component hybrid sensor and regulator n=2 Tax=Sulfurospirillum multivorans TaxID=66821 RepID=A0AA86AL37_SULMK|nr:two-component hybrid sensor and regulator [Sulfurospirillum multivorans DSM 12446]QEH06096.1 two-component hybrid sensor and regulator [Sulfurospirillum multivorans]
MDLHKKLSLFHYFHIIALILFLTFASIFFALNFYNAKIKFETESHRLQKEYSDAKKKMLIMEVDRFVAHIEEKRQEAYAQAQELVKARVYEAYEIATKIYQAYHKTHSDAQIAAMIVDTLRLLRYENN